MKRLPRSSWRILHCVLAFAFVTSAAAEVSTVRVVRQYGIGYLQMVVMERQRLIEHHAARAGLGTVTVVWNTIANPAAGNDAMLAGDVDFVAGGLGSFATLWDRTRDTLGVKGIAALDSMPMLLNTRDPAIRSIRDLEPGHRVAIPGVKVSSQATTLQFAAAQAFGHDEWQRLDHLTVGMGHPTGMQALLSERSGIAAHFTSPPYQYEELRQPGVHTILDSYDVWGGPQTFILAWTTARFRSDNPMLYRAFLDSLRDATAFIDANRRDAAALYVAATGDRTMSVERLAAMLADPKLHFTLVPQNVMKFVQFKARIGNVRTPPDSWKDLFFPEIHDLPGS
jgi:NitT/TauT family transport system substrate-binding protein